MTRCLICEHSLTIVELSCSSCNTTYKSNSFFPRLTRLSLEEQRLTEALVLHGGNLKEMAEGLDVSYPTLKKRLNDLTLSLKEKKNEDEKKIEEILVKIEEREMNAEEGIKLIREINGEL